MSSSDPIFKMLNRHNVDQILQHAERQIGRLAGDIAVGADTLRFEHTVVKELAEYWLKHNENVQSSSIVVLEQVETPLGPMRISRSEVARLHYMATSKAHYLTSGSNMPENEVNLWRDILILTTHWLNCLPKEG